MAMLTSRMLSSGVNGWTMAPFLVEASAALFWTSGGRMELTDLEREFLRKLLGESCSPPMFDHEIVARLVELGLVETEPLRSGDIEYRITDAGRAAATA
jgi:hypothetical protein